MEAKRRQRLLADMLQAMCDRALEHDEGVRVVAVDDGPDLDVVLEVDGEELEVQLVWHDSGEA